MTMEITKSAAAKKLTAWQRKNPDIALGADTIQSVLRVKTLEGIDLQGLDLLEADLPNVNLRGANLMGVNFQGADIQGADFKNANLSDADLRDANAQNANFAGAILLRTDLRGASLRGTNLSGCESWGILRIDGLPYGQVTFLPTKDGWELRVGLWIGEVSDYLSQVLTTDGPEAKSNFAVVTALTALCFEHERKHADTLENLSALPRRYQH